MVNPFLCGHFHSNVDGHPDHDHDPWTYKPTTTKKSRKSSKNPYSTCGLEKFSALLADLDRKKQQIYSQFNPQEISFVRFVFPDSNDCVPVVVKKSKIDDDLTKRSRNLRDSEIEKLKLKSKSDQRRLHLCYLIVILILMLLAVFGRLISILITCIWWYAVPSMKFGEESGKPSTKKKEYVRGLSDRLCSVAGAGKERSQRHRNHRKSW